MSQTNLPEADLATTDLLETDIQAYLKQHEHKEMLRFLHVAVSMTVKVP